MSPIASALLGLVVGLALGGLGTWWIMSRAAARSVSTVPPAASPPAVEASEDASGAAASPVDEGGLKDVIDASRNLVEDLERRYARAEPGGGEPPAAARPRSGRRRPPR